MYRFIFILSLSVACTGAKGPSPADDTAEMPDTADTADTGEADEPADPADICNGEDDDGDGIIDEGMLGTLWTDEERPAWQVGPSVASVTTAMDTESDGEVDIATTEHFGPDGLITERHSSYNHPDIDDASTLYFYNDAGRLTKQQELNGSSEVFMEIRLTWEDGLLTENRMFMVSAEGEYTAYTSILYAYDDEGYPLSVSTYVYDADEPEEIIWVSWSPDRLSRTDEYYDPSADEVTRIGRTTFSATDKVLEYTIHVGSAEEPAYQVLSEFNEADRVVVRETTYAGEEGLIREEYEYDAKGRLQWVYEDRIDEGSSSVLGWVWEGDTVSELVGSSSDDPGGEIWTFSRYIFDSSGNVTERIGNPDGHSSSATSTTTYSYTCH